MSAICSKLVDGENVQRPIDADVIAEDEAEAKKVFQDLFKSEYAPRGWELGDSCHINEVFTPQLKMLLKHARDRSQRPNHLKLVE